MTNQAARNPPKPTPAPKLLRVREAAHELAVSPRTIWRMIRAGELTPVRIGRSVRVTRAAIDLLCESPGQ